MVTLGKIAYETFFKELGRKPQLEWDKQEPEVQDAWTKAALRVVEEYLRIEETKYDE
jgi:hypothetical protein